jgi:2-iminobutanoate/2-iminopropanoate deaminase
MKTLNTAQAAPAIGPYSHGVVTGNLLYTSGQLAADKNGDLAQGIVAQATQVMENLKAIATAAGTDLTRTVKTTCFLADMNDFATFNEVYAKYFTEKPARSCIQVARIPKDALLEVEAIIEV